MAHPTRDERAIFAFGERESQGHQNQGTNSSNGHHQRMLVSVVAILAIGRGPRSKASRVMLDGHRAPTQSLELWRDDCAEVAIRLVEAISILAAERSEPCSVE